jgi:hypothetical protein
MKKQLLTFAAISTMILASCGGSNEVESDLDSLLDEIEMTDETENETVIDKDDESESNTEIIDDSSSSDEWDSVLDDYESYVDDYVAIIKKQKENPTDMSIMTEYQELMQKGTEWSTKMSEMSSNFGTEQLSRMLEIQEKLSKAAM